MENQFTINHLNKDSRARTGTINTAHGPVYTPAFIPDATYGAVKHLSPDDLKTVGTQMILGNTYHLHIRPGADFVTERGGIHTFLQWNQPILTDSGGWQALSLVYRNKMGKVLEEGVEFRDHLTGDKHLLTPELSLEAQLTMGSDICIVLDFPVNPDAPKKDNQQSLRLTKQWAKRSKNTFTNHKNNKNKILYAVVQGANDPEMRKQSYEDLAELGFDGYSFGGPPENNDVVNFTAQLIPSDKVRYMLGSGPPWDIVTFIEMGWDLFDCVVPTRNARHGLLYTTRGEVRITQHRYKTDNDPIDPQCNCYTCKTFPRWYIHHLFRIKEPLGQRLATLHNMHYYMWLMKESRSAIENDSITSFAKEVRSVYNKD